MSAKARSPAAGHDSLPPSLDDPSEEALAETWLSEAGRRAGEIERGEVEPVSAEEVRRRARALLR